MESRGTRRVNLGVALIVLGITLLILLIPLAIRGWAQASADPMRPADLARSEEVVAIVLIVAAGLLLVLGVVGKMLDLRLKRDGEAVAVRGVISDALRRDPGLLGISITPTVRVPLWRGAPVTIRVAGQVPSDQLRRAALRSIKRTAKSDLLVRVRIKSRIGVVPTASPSAELEQRERVDRRAGRVLEPEQRDLRRNRQRRYPSCGYRSEFPKKAIERSATVTV